MPDARRPRLLTALVLLLITGALAGCSSGLVEVLAPPSALPHDYTSTIQSGGRTRSYIVHLPPGYTSAHTWPLILTFHVGDGTAAQMVALTHLNAIADAHNFIVVYPQGVANQWADGRGITLPDQAGVNDVRFTLDLLAVLTPTLKIDARRVYATGVSNGGFMAHRLACDQAGRIAAIAPVAATLSEATAGACRPARPVPVLLIQGTADPFVTYNGRDTPPGTPGKLLSVPATVRRWTTLDGCQGDPARADEPDRAADGTRIHRDTYADCAAGSEVILYTVEGGGHTWPGGQQYQPVATIGKTSRDLDAGEVIWDFFARHPR